MMGTRRATGRAKVPGHRADEYGETRVKTMVKVEWITVARESATIWAWKRHMSNGSSFGSSLSGTRAQAIEAAASIVPIGESVPVYQTGLIRPKFLGYVSGGTQ